MKLGMFTRTQIDGIEITTTAGKKDDHAALTKLAAARVGQVFGRDLSEEAVTGMTKLKDSTLIELAGAGMSSPQPAQAPTTAAGKCDCPPPAISAKEQADILKAKNAGTHISKVMQERK